MPTISSRFAGLGKTVESDRWERPIFRSGSWGFQVSENSMPLVKAAHPWTAPAGQSLLLSSRVPLLAVCSNPPDNGRMTYSATPTHPMVSTTFDIAGYRVVRTLGVVRGIVVRSRSIFGTIGAGLQTLVGGNITLLTNLCEKTRGEGFDFMLRHAGELAANAVIGASYDATEVMQGVIEVLAYGTAVVVERTV